MTTRQQQLRDKVLAVRDEILARFNPSDGAGHVEIVRLPAQFEVTHTKHLQLRGETTILVMRLPDGYVWKEHAIYRRKGFSEPSWKALA